MSASEWRQDRFLLACGLHGIGSPKELLEAVNKHRRATDPDAQPMLLRTAERYFNGERAPTNGRPPGVYELAEVLNASIDWLMGRSEVSRVG